MKTKWTSALLLTSALLTGGFFSTSALAQAAPPADSAQVQQSVAQETNRISINTATAEELARNSVVSGRKSTADCGVPHGKRTIYFCGTTEGCIWYW